LQERNLFLIQNVQQTEEALEEVKQKYADTDAKMSEKTGALRTNIEELRAKINAEHQKTESLLQRAR